MNWKLYKIFYLFHVFCARNRAVIWEGTMRVCWNHSYRSLALRFLVGRPAANLNITLRIQDLFKKVLDVVVVVGILGDGDWCLAPSDPWKVPDSLYLYRDLDAHTQSCMQAGRTHATCACVRPPLNTHTHLIHSAHFPESSPLTPAENNSISSVCEVSELSQLIVWPNSMRLWDVTRAPPWVETSLKGKCHPLISAEARSQLWVERG